MQREVLGWVSPILRGPISEQGRFSGNPPYQGFANYFEICSWLYSLVGKSQ